MAISDWSPEGRRKYRRYLVARAGDRFWRGAACRHGRDVRGDGYVVAGWSPIASKNIATKWRPS